MIKFIKNYVEAKRRKKALVKSEIERKKLNFVYRFLLNNYERSTEGKVDLPAFIYATRDMQDIRAMGKVNEAYDNAKKVLLREFKKKDEKDIDLEIKEQIQYDADWAELQAERDEALLWGV